ncbi:hypothetical protein PIB30_025164 [Stylosanthes scabra]|uniref:GRF-type domain-containing protein n=1 Tax=Stylosanthes scabra TaxID=79078 RepID=A0ABU6Y777_9FABA|nr:hypothetical protein [Stylosanthes scabra]
MEAAAPEESVLSEGCHYGAYVILFLSGTNGNPNRLFLGCSNFKTSTSHCKYFKWLDEYVSSNVAHDPASNVEVLGDIVNLKRRIATLENMVAQRAVGNRGNIKCWGFFFFFLGVVVTTCLLVAGRF